MIHGRFFDDKVVTNKIKIVRELTEDEVTKYALDQFKLKLESLPIYGLTTELNHGLIRVLPTIALMSSFIHNSI